MPSITRPIVPYHPFIFPPPFKKAFRRHTWLPPPLPPQQKLERPIVPYYPYKFPPPPSRKQANPPLSYHAFPPPTLPLPAKKLYMSEVRRAAPPPPPKKPYQWPKGKILLKLN
ncbi:extensin-3-like [Cucumis melo var. makuwa]|uniref:Extensin-3-like n=1 Tax=Cucumis melo var. makuwa TaxID=1194695 RepID=A0A5D3CVI1_CUCMM|nr:extensin-3-like [Cucumis melo var. makuwa]TYK15370.1 extensin-3-like [Cucumis melo var. makuwa]